MTIKLFSFVLFILACNKNTIPSTNATSIKRTSYYFSTEGNDANNGSLLHPLRTIAYLNTLNLNNGDSVLFKANETFTGNIQLKINNISNKNFTLTSYGNGNAIIDAGNATAITINQSANINIKNIICKGAGRKNGNITNGILINNCNNVTISNADVSSFQKAGLLIYKSHHVTASGIYTHDNGFAGISISGENKKDDCSDIYIKHCKAENNPGDPTNFNNHSGNGIIAGFCKNILIEYCTASNNGWDMPRIGNGPVGIWCYEADSVIIQHCISFKNKTSKGGEDGGGYDFDGGTTNSVIQYCLSYENYGSAFGIFQYAGGSPWHNNIIRFCISENDGKVSAAHANAYIWNSSHDSSQFKNFLFYNNTIYNDSNAVISYSFESEHSNFKFYNNIFVAADKLITGKYEDDIFIANDWWSLQNGFNISNNHNFKSWCVINNKEQLNGQIAGLNIMPLFKNAVNTTFTNATGLNNFNSYKIVDLSSVTQAGINLQGLFNINTGNEDFNGKPVNKNYLGACTGK